MRFRIDRGYGIGYALLLWPASEHWPPEIDFGEDGGGSRQRTTATVHYGAQNSTIARSVSVDFSRWHTLGVEWSPGVLAYTLDGRSWATVRSTSVPSVPMEFDMQTQAGTCGYQFAPCPNSTTPTQVNLDVDWVVIYSRV